MPSSSNEIYLDNNATTRVHPKVCEAVHQCMLDSCGNASSAHRAGEAARRRLFRARTQVGRLFHAMPENIVFGSGSTELNNWILFQHCQRPGSHLITSSVEHTSVLRVAEVLAAKQVEVTFLPVDSDGLIDLQSLRNAICGRTSLVSLQWVNGETGVIQDVGQLAEVCAAAGIPFHVDGAQALGKVNMDMQATQIDFVTCSAHKLHGPQGVGASYCRDIKSLKASTVGGMQEFGLRAGTENVPGIVGFGVAAECRDDSFEEINDSVKALRDLFEKSVLAAIPLATVNGSQLKRVSNTANICFGGIDGEALVATLDRDGLRCSQSSACSSQIPEPSHVLVAMGLSEADAYSSVRFSFSQFSTRAEVEKAVELVTKRVTELSENRMKSYA